MKYSLAIFLLISCFNTSAQVAITTDNSTADSTAMLDIKSISKGVLIPRLSNFTKNNIISPANGLLIYQTDSIAGFYYNSGTRTTPVWMLMTSNSTSWLTYGNKSTSSNDFIGTTDNNPFRIRLNNLPSGIFDPVLQNISLGTGSLAANAGGSNNIAIGWGAMKNNTQGLNMVAIGDSALYNQTTSPKYYNTAVGSKALFANTVGYENSAFGNAALISNTTGADNTAIGDGALRLNTSGFVNNALGLHALYYNTTGGYNTGMGAFALFSNTTGSGNTAMGLFADVLSGDLSNAMALGYNAKVDASDKVRIGSVAVTSIGGQVSWTTFSDGRFKKDLRYDVPGMEFISKLQPVSYTVDVAGLDNYYNRNSSSIIPLRFPAAPSPLRQSGFIAQDVEKAAKQAGYPFSGVDKPSNKDALYGLRYSEFVVPIIKGMQEQQAIIEKQELLIEKLESRISKLEAEHKNGN